ncbi:MAG: cysteine--tRNA ligase [Dehalococcoidia bacterium]
MLRSRAPPRGGPSNRRSTLRGARRLLEIYDSRTRQTVPFTPVEPGVVRLYVCGVTPYDVGHLGHARTFVFFDVVRRYLEFQAYEVRHIQNITDVDDDMVRVSRAEGVSIAELTERNHRIHLREMDALNVLRPQAFPLASEHIPGIIAMVERLVASGHAYVVDGHVFFDTTTTPRFGALSGLDRDALRTFRNDSMPDEPEHLKRDSLDFLIWQPSTAEGASFDSPWGRGRPGWHIECSVMAQSMLGPRIDIHGGGSDLAYPHHDCEIVQSEAASGEAPFVGTWMHVGTLQLEHVKMSKSLGNLVKVSELLAQGHSPDAIRLYLLSAPYREAHNFETRELEDYERRAAALRSALDAPGGPADLLRVQAARNEFQAAMDDDFDTAGASEVLERIASDLEAGRLQRETARPTLIELADVLGLRLGQEG